MFGSIIRSKYKTYGLNRSLIAKNVANAILFTRC